MSAAAANLVDSNFFIRSLLLTLERVSAAGHDNSQEIQWTRGIGTRFYLSHSWWDTQAISLTCDKKTHGNVGEDAYDSSRPSDWFPPNEIVQVNGTLSNESAILPSGLEESVGHFGWVFTPADAYHPNTLEHLSWFLAANQARLLRDLLGVVDLRNINHENICCLNTAVVVLIFAHRRKHLSALLRELRQMSDEEKEFKRRAAESAKQDDTVDRSFIQAMRSLDLGNQQEMPAYARRASILGSTHPQQIGDGNDVMRNFREVLWFWMEYYTNRGRDRLSLEFSSHIRFQEWNQVVALLAADDTSPTSLVRAPVRLPLSPYRRSARVPFGRLNVSMP